RAGMTRVSLNTSRSPGRSRVGSSRTTWWEWLARPEGPPRRRTSRRAASRSAAGSWAIRSGGSSKSKAPRACIPVRVPGLAPGETVGAGQGRPPVAFAPSLLLEPLDPCVERLGVLVHGLRRAGELDLVDVLRPVVEDGDHLVVGPLLRFRLRVEWLGVVEVGP